MSAAILLESLSGKTQARRSELSVEGTQHQKVPRSSHSWAQAGTHVAFPLAPLVHTPYRNEPPPGSLSLFFCAAAACAETVERALVPGNTAGFTTGTAEQERRVCPLHGLAPGLGGPREAVTPNPPRGSFLNRKKHHVN